MIMSPETSGSVRSYLLEASLDVGEGIFHWDDKDIPCRAGD